MIVGGVIGGVVLLIAFGLAIFLIRRRRESLLGPDTRQAPSPRYSPYAIEPFDANTMSQVVPHSQFVSDVPTSGSVVLFV